jgi:hypothetical protein
VNPADPGTPRMTMRTLTDYLTATGAHQRATLIENMYNRLGRGTFAPYYQDARMAIRRYAQGDGHALKEEVQRLLRARHGVDGRHLAKINANLRVITDYRDKFSGEDITHVQQQFQPLHIRGVRVSTEPTLSGTILTGRRRIPCNVVIDTQEDTPTESEVDYMLELLYRGSGHTHETGVSGAQYWHPSSGEVWTLTRSSKRRWRDVEEACYEIALRWPTFGIR